MWTADDFDTLVALAKAQTPPIDPAAVAIVLWEESGLNPANPGPAQASPPVGGLNQMSSTNLKALGLTREAWLGMSAGEQLPIVFRWWGQIADRFNGGRFPADEGELLGLNFLPGAYKLARASDNPDAVIAGAGGPYAWAFKDNPQLAAGSASITVNTCRTYLANVAQKAGSAWQSVLAQIAAAVTRYNQGTPTPPEPFARGGNGPAGIVALLVLTGAAVWFATRRA